MDKSQLYKVPLKYGLAGGVLSILIFLVLYWSNIYPLEVGTYIINGIVIVIMLFFSIKELRDYKYEGKLEYWQGISAGMVCVLVICFLSSLFLIIFIKYVDSEILVQHQQYMMENIVENKESLIENHGVETYEQVLSQSKETVSPWTIALDDFIKKGVIGLFFSTIIALSFKHTK